MWNRIAHISGWTIGIACLFVLLGASVSSAKRAQLTQVKVKIDFGEGNFFIQEKEIAEVVSDLGYWADSTAMIDIDPGRIELALENNAFILDAEVYEELNGVLHVDVDVRQPIIRIYNIKGESVYLDEQGRFMPLSPSYAARTPIANGLVTVNLKSFIGHKLSKLADSLNHPDMVVLQSLYEIVSTCRKDKFWKAQFNQYYVNSDHEIQMIPRVGDHIVLVGNAQDIDKKLNKLKLFYDRGLNKTGWNEYKTINLKYANQVVCTKS
jgi:cell division protein FtsQ